MKKYEAYEFFGTLQTPWNINVPKFTDVDMWTEFFLKLGSYDIFAPLNFCIAMICFDMFECMPDGPYRQFYFELGIEAMDGDKAYICEGAINAGFVERGIVDIVNFAVSGSMPDSTEGMREALRLVFDDQTYYLRYLTDDQIRVAHRFAYPIWEV